MYEIVEHSGADGCAGKQQEHACIADIVDGKAEQIRSKPYPEIKEDKKG